MNIAVDQYGVVQVPDGYHLYTTSAGCTMLVRDEPLFKEGDIIETAAPVCGNYLAVVDYIDTDGGVCYKVLVHLDGNTYKSSSEINEVYLNGRHSIIQDNWTKIPIDSLSHKLIVRLYKNCWNK